MTVINGHYATYAWYHSHALADDRFGYGHGSMGYITVGHADSLIEAKSAAESLAATHGLTVQALRPRPGSSAADRDKRIQAERDKATREKQNEAVCNNGPFEGAPVATPLSVASTNIAVGKLGDWLTSESTSEPGVYAASEAVVVQMRAQGRADFVIVCYQGSLHAVTMAEAYERHLRESQDAQWHRDLGWGAFNARVADTLREAGSI